MFKLLFALLAAVLVTACDSDSSPPPTTPPPPPPPPQASFEISVSNLTNAQPISPIAVIAHRAGYAAFSIGIAASAGLEELAEGGDNSALLAEAGADAAVITGTSGGGPIGPAGNETLTINLANADRPGLLISVAGMLVNTNDGFTALNGLPVETMAVGDKVSVNAVAYDAGTEADTEAAGSIPGPAAGGEGFNPARDDDADRVAMHAGVISVDDGRTGSGLTEQHRFDNPVARITIERTQ
jgi:hypothetical protein